MKKSMITLDPEMEKDIKAGITTAPELSAYFLRTHTMKDICDSFAELYLNSYDLLNQEPITLSQEEYNRVMSLFRVRGINAKGEKETRGRKKLDPHSSASMEK